MISGSKQAPNYQTVKHFKKNNSARRDFPLKLQRTQLAPHTGKSGNKIAEQARDTRLEAGYSICLPNENKMSFRLYK
jgi:hypothetical protein